MAPAEDPKTPTPPAPYTWRGRAVELAALLAVLALAKYLGIDCIECLLRLFP